MLDSSGVGCDFLRARTQANAHMHAHTYVHTTHFMPTRTQTSLIHILTSHYMHAYSHTYMHTCIHVTHTSRTRTHTYKHTRPTHIHTHTHAHTHAHTQVLGWSKDPKAVRALCWDLAEAYGATLLAQDTPAAPGLRCALLYRVCIYVCYGCPREKNTLPVSLSSPPNSKPPIPH